MSQRLEITVAHHAGFCMGVRRALNSCLEAAANSSYPRPVSTIGPLIHNKQVLKVLEQKGVRVMADEPDQKTGTAIIRAHGVSPEKRRSVCDVSSKIIDATCPHVRKVQNIVKKYSALGYRCIIVGDPGHAEVEGVMSYAGDAGTVVSGAPDAERLDNMKKAVIVAQTTQNEKVFEEVSSIIKAKCGECKEFDTICRATQNRQDEAISLARSVEAMVVVGGYNSANTCRLAQICAATGTPTFHVETEAELQTGEILKFRKIGITAGASTPNWMIKRVINSLQRAEEELSRPPLLMIRRIAEICLRSNIFLGGGAAAVTYAAFVIMSLAVEMLEISMLLAFCFITSQHLLHQYTKQKAMLLNDPGRGLFFESHAGLLLLLATLTGSAAIFLSFFLGMLQFALILAGTVGGIMYCIPEKASFLSSRLALFQKLTGTKEFFVALAWTATAVLLPFISSGYDASPVSLVSFALFVLILVFHRTLLSDLQDLEGDQLAGRETIALLFGGRAAFWLLISLSAMMFFLMAVPAYFNLIPAAGYVILLVPLYCMLTSLAYAKDVLPVGEAGDAINDAVFYLAGICAFVGAALV